MPFESARHHRPVRGAGLVNRLKQAAAEGAAINHVASEPQPLQRRPVHDAAPLAVATAIEAFGMFELQQRFCFTIAGLLFQVRAWVLAAMMPDKRAGRHGNPVAGLLQTPADIDVVPCLAILRIEAIDCFEHLAAKGHVAARNVLGHLIAFQDVHRLPGRRCDAGGQPTIRRSQVWSADRRRPGTFHLINKMGEPIAVHVAIGVGIGDDCARRCLQADVARHAETHVRLMDGADVRKMAQDIARVVGRAVIDDDYFVIGIVEDFQRMQTLLERRAAVVGANDHGHARRLLQMHRRRIGVELAHRMIRGLGQPIGVRDAERPVLDLMAAGVPVVGPGEYERACQPAKQTFAQVPREKIGLRHFPVAQGVHAEFA